MKFYLGWVVESWDMISKEMLQKAFGFVELEFEVTVPKMMKYIVLDRKKALLHQAWEDKEISES